MDRYKYCNNNDYREGYNECLEDNSIKAVKLLQMEIEPIIKQLQALYSKLTDTDEKEQG